MAAAAVWPVWVMRLGFLPHPVGVILVAAALASSIMRRDRVVVMLAVVATATVVGYGIMYPWPDPRLVSHLNIVLIALVCTGRRKSAGAAEPGRQNVQGRPSVWGLRVQFPPRSVGVDPPTSSLVVEPVPKQESEQQLAVLLERSFRRGR